MKIQGTLPNSNNAVSQNDTQQKTLYVPTFKAAGGAFAGTLNSFGRIMQGIEDGGFLASFLIQDALGMTAPRVGAAFLRDKEVTGQYNTQEGFEVLGREGLTGPCMMAVAPIMFALAAKFGRTTSVNSQLIQRFGNSLKDMLKNPNFDRSLLKDKTKFKQEFYRQNIQEILNNTLGKENVTDDAVKFILEQIEKYEKIPSDAVLPKNLIGIKSKRKYRNSRLDKIANYINDIKYSTSSDLTMLDKLKLGNKDLNNVKPYSTRDVIEAMVKYSDDSITLNKNLDKLNEISAEDIKNASIAKRLLANITTIFATLGVLSVLPKLYIRSNVAPGARTAMQLKAAKESEQQVKNDKNNHIATKSTNDNKSESNEDSVTQSDITFKGKNPKKSWLAKLGEKFSKFVNKDFVAGELEYNGHNFTNSLMAGLSLFGLLAPRGLKAYNRAQVDEDGKKDLTELYEILIRDISSSLAVVFAVPMLTRAAVTSYENKSGFVLMHKDRNMSKLATTLDLINPYSKAHVLTNMEINSLYNGVDSQEKMLNFCKYIDQNGGDLQKILAKSENANIIFNDNAIKVSDLSKLTKSEKNTQISEYFSKLGKDGKLGKKTVDEMITKLMKGVSGKSASNKILGFARGLNSVPGVITTFLISPYLLGWFIPRLTYANTRRIHAKQEKERQEKLNKINASA